MGYIDAANEQEGYSGGANVQEVQWWEGLPQEV